MTHSGETIVSRSGPLGRKQRGTLARLFIPTGILIFIVISFRYVVEMGYKVSIKNEILFNVRTESMLSYFANYEYKSDGTGAGSTVGYLSFATVPSITGEFGFNTSAYIIGKVTFKALINGVVGFES